MFPSWQQRLKMLEQLRHQQEAAAITSSLTAQLNETTKLNLLLQAMERACPLTMPAAARRLAVPSVVSTTAPVTASSSRRSSSHASHFHFRYLRSLDDSLSGHQQGDDDSSLSSTSSSSSSVTTTGLNDASKRRPVAAATTTAKRKASGMIPLESPSRLLTREQRNTNKRARTTAGPLAAPPFRLGTPLEQRKVKEQTTLLEARTTQALSASVSRRKKGPPCVPIKKSAGRITKRNKNYARWIAPLQNEISSILMD